MELVRIVLVYRAALYAILGRKPAIHRGIRQDSIDFFQMMMKLGLLAYVFDVWLSV